MIGPLPPPTTFSEGQRQLFGCLMACAGVFCGCGFAGIILLLWLGGWTQASEGQRIGAIAMMGAGFPLGMISVIIAMAVGGPVGRFKAAASKDGLSVEAEDASVTATATVTRAP